MILTDTLKSACRDHGRGRLRRPRPQVSDLGAGTLPRATRGGHREGARAQAAAGLPGGGATTRTEHGNDGGPRQRSPAVAGGPARHIPVLARPRRRATSTPRDGGIYIDGTFGAGGYTRAILEAARLPRHRHRSRPAARSRAAPTWSKQSGGRLTLVEDRFSESRRRRAQPRHRRGRRHRARSRRLVDAARPGRARLLVPHRRPARHAHGRRGPERRRCRRARVASAISPPSSATLGEERFARAVARAIVSARAEAPITHHARARRHRRRASCAAPPARFIRRRARSRRCASSSTTSSANSPTRSAPPSACSRRAAGSSVISFHSLEDRIVKTFLAERGTACRRLAPSAARSSAPPPSFTHADQAGRSSPTMPRSPPIRARAPPSCAPPSAPSAGADRRRSRASAAAPAVARRRDAGALMMLRLLNIVVIAALVLAAADVYKIKFESTLQAEHVAKLRDEIRRERDAIAILRAEWAQARPPRPHPGAGAAPSDAEADRVAAVRQLRQAARAAAADRAARHAPIRSAPMHRDVRRCRSARPAACPIDARRRQPMRRSDPLTPSRRRRRCRRSRGAAA